MKDQSLSPELDSIELHPDAWERTERAIKAAAGRKPAPAKKPALRRQTSVIGKRKS